MRFSGKCHCSDRDILGMFRGGGPEMPHPCQESFLRQWEGFGFILGGG